ncbi:MAG: hypothetical protein AB7L66_18110 [Gemmatimonadales bacterium]
MASSTCVLTALLVGLGLPAWVGPAAGQTCTPQSIATHPGAWKENPANLALARETAPAALHARILKRIEPVAAMFREAYPTPHGTAAEGYASIRLFGRELVGGPAQYGYVSLYKTWLCPKSTGKPSLADETGNWAYVYVNSLSSMLKSLSDDSLEVDGRPARVWLLARRAGTLRGEPLYEPWLGFGGGGALVFAKEGALPWKVLSRKQYLAMSAAWHRNQRAKGNQAADQLVRNLEKAVEEAKQSPPGPNKATIVAEMERALADAKAQTAAGRAKGGAATSGDLKAIDDYLAAHSAADLAQPAILGPNAGLVFAGEFGTEADGGHQVVVIDPGYFRRDLPADAAQLVTLLWRSEKDSPASSAWREGFEARFPIEKLRAMVGR